MTSRPSPRTAYRPSETPQRGRHEPVFVTRTGELVCGRPFGEISTFGVDARSIPRSRLRRFALCTGAVAAAVALFPGMARADGGLSALVGDTVEQLAPPAADPVVDPVVDVISTVAPAVEEAVPPALDPTVAAVIQAADATTDSVLPTLPALHENEGSTEAPAGGTPQMHEPVSGAGSAQPVTPEADAPAPIETGSAPIATARASEQAEQAAQAAPARPASAVRVDTSAGEKHSAAVSRQPAVGSPQTPPPGDIVSSAPAPPVIVAATQPDSARSLPAFPRPADSGLPGFDVPLPPLAAFALLLALPLGLLALTAPGPRGRGVSPGVALLCSADVRFRLVRPG